MNGLQQNILQRIYDGSYADDENDGLVNVCHIEEFVRMHRPDPIKLQQELDAWLEIEERTVGLSAMSYDTMKRKIGELMEALND